MTTEEGVEEVEGKSSFDSRWGISIGQVGFRALRGWRRREKSQFMFRPWKMQALLEIDLP